MRISAIWLLFVPVFFITAFGLAVIANHNFKILFQFRFFLQSVFVSALLYALFFKLSSSSMNGDKEEAKLGLLLVIPLITVTHLYGLNALWISHRMVRTVTITSKSLTSPWGDKGSRSRSNSTICQVEVPSYRNSRQSIVTELPCGLWTSAQPGVTQLKIETQIGITGIEFAEVL